MWPAVPLLLALYRLGVVDEYLDLLGAFASVAFDDIPFCIWLDVCVGLGWWT